MTPVPIHILVVAASDCPAADAVQRLLDDTSFSRISCSYVRVLTLHETLLRLREELFDAIFLSLDLPESKGVDSFETIHHQIPDMPVVALVEKNGASAGLSAVEHGAVGYLVGTRLPRHVIVSMLHTALGWRRLRTEYEAEMQQIQIVGNRLETIIHRSVDAILILDRQGRILFANPSAGRLFQRTVAQLTGSNFEYPVVVDQTLAIELAQPGGSQAIAEMRVATIDWGGEHAYLATLRNATERKQLENRLLKRRRWKALAVWGGCSARF
ncbi:MAG: PAS domain S-box protein [candidate division Zixibacteria bacterium]|nr:PAS domain S-box protein [candidate division Zixibacteria bacterium]